MMDEHTPRFTSEATAKSRLRPKTEDRIHRVPKHAETITIGDFHAQVPSRPIFPGTHGFAD